MSDEKSKCQDEPVEERPKDACELTDEQLAEGTNGGYFPPWWAKKDPTPPAGLA